MNTRTLALALKRTVHSLEKAQTQARTLEPLNAPTLAGQPLDQLLLLKSPLYRTSRSHFLKAGGSLEPALLSSPRSLASGTLTSLRIEYTPSESELFWTASDPTESKTRPERLLELRTWTTSVFHEQNHRTLWKFLPPAPSQASALSRYLHFAESLVVSLDMALADHLGPKLAQALYQVGAIYDPGTETLKTGPQPPEDRARAYRNYLQAAAYATYLNLELFHPDEIPGIVSTLYPKELYRERNQKNWSLRAAARALRLDRQFVENTNPVWQRKHLRALPKAFAQIQSRRLKPLVLPEHPLDHALHTFWMDRVFTHFGL